MNLQKVKVVDSVSQFSAPVSGLHNLILYNMHKADGARGFPIKTSLKENNFGESCFPLSCSTP